MELNDFQLDASKNDQDEREVEPLLNQEERNQNSIQEEIKDNHLAITKSTILNFAWKFILPILYILFIGLFPLTYHEYMSLDPASHPEGLESTIFSNMYHSSLR